MKSPKRHLLSSKMSDKNTLLTDPDIEQLALRKKNLEEEAKEAMTKYENAIRELKIVSNTLKLKKRWLFYSLYTYETCNELAQTWVENVKRNSNPLQNRNPEYIVQLIFPDLHEENYFLLKENYPSEVIQYALKSLGIKMSISLRT